MGVNDAVNYEAHEAVIGQYLTDLPPTSFVFVAVEDVAKILGVASVRATLSVHKGFTAELEGIYVLPSRQREGVGHRLVLEAARWSQSDNHRGLRLWVVRTSPYRRFYETLAAEPLNQTQRQTFGGRSVTALAYGWRDLRALIHRLEQEAGNKPEPFDVCATTVPRA